VVLAHHVDARSRQKTVNTLGIAHQTQASAKPEPATNALHWSWQKAASNTVNDIDSLADLLALDKSKLHQLCQQNAFKLRVPLPFVSRMQAGDINDPLLRQVLPLRQELLNPADLSHDPLNEQQYNVLPGLVHKYAGRVLLTATVSCPINCRYCFRRHFPYDKNRLTPNNWDAAIEYIRNDSSIKEVILSGGEPLLLNDRSLASLLSEIESVAHVKHIRIHSRFPIVIPQRLNEALCTRLIESRCNVALVLHSNHPNEIDEHVAMHLKTLVESRVSVLNQSVLLKDINDNVDTLIELSEKLYDAGVLPYYLHATDPVVGTAHFQVSDKHGQELALALANNLPGYLVPTLVREISGKSGKTRLPLT